MTTDAVGGSTPPAVDGTAIGTDGTSGLGEVAPPQPSLSGPERDWKADLGIQPDGQDWSGDDVSVDFDPATDPAFRAAFREARENYDKGRTYEGWTHEQGFDSALRHVWAAALDSRSSAGTPSIFVRALESISGMYPAHRSDSAAGDVARTALGSTFCLNCGERHADDVWCADHTRARDEVAELAGNAKLLASKVECSCDVTPDGYKRTCLRCLVIAQASRVSRGTAHQSRGGEA